MKALGLIFLVLGVLSFLVPLPHRERHGFSVGDTRFSVQTEHSEKLPPVVGIVLIGGGVAAMVLGSRRR